MCKFTFFVPAWGYGTDNGPSTWGQYAEVCESGQRQSPIDLPAVEANVAIEYGPIVFEGSYTDVNNAEIVSRSENIWDQLITMHLVGYAG